MNAATPRRAIICFGEALVDLLARPPPTAGAPRQFVEYAGGAPANVAVAVARLGGDARFVGMCTGMRMVRAWSAIERVIAWRIHHVA